MRLWLRPGESTEIAIRILDERADEIEARGSDTNPEPWREADRHYTTARALEAMA